MNSQNKRFISNIGIYIAIEISWELYHDVIGYQQLVGYELKFTDVQDARSG
jgi:hypothetical protein